MVLLIDGYNVIKYLLPHNSREHDAQRDWLIARLATYARVKRDEISGVTIVFDGGLFRHRHREVHRSVAVVFSGHQRSADDVLVEYAQSFGAQAVIVTNDRELSDRCRVNHSQVIKVDMFHDLCSRVENKQDREVSKQFGSVAVTKLADNDDSSDDPELDALMEAASMGGQCFEKDEREAQVRVSSGRKLSKAERVRQRLKKKLG